MLLTWLYIIVVIVQRWDERELLSSLINAFLMLPFFQYGHRKNYNKNSIPYLIAPSVAMYIINRVNHKYTLFCLYHVFRPCYLSGSNSSEIHILYNLNCCKNVILWVKAVTLKGMTLSKEANLPEWILISIIYNKQKASKKCATRDFISILAPDT